MSPLSLRTAALRRAARRSRRRRRSPPPAHPLVDDVHADRDHALERVLELQVAQAAGLLGLLGLRGRGVPLLGLLRLRLPRDLLGWQEAGLLPRLLRGDLHGAVVDVEVSVGPEGSGIRAGCRRDGADQKVSIW